MHREEARMALSMDDVNDVAREQCIVAVDSTT